MLTFHFLYSACSVFELSIFISDPNLHPGTILLSTNGVPYTYQNGMAIFHAPESGYPIHQPQVRIFFLSICFNLLLKTAFTVLAFYLHVF